MEETKSSKTKIILLTIAGILALVFFWTLLNKYVLKPRAVGETVGITFDPSSGQIKAGEENTVDIFFKAPESRGISGIDMVLTAKNAQILDVSNALPVSGDPTATFTEILTDVPASGEYARKSVVAIQPDDKLSQIVRMQVIYQCKSAGEARLSIDKTKTEIVGNTSGDTYELASLSDAVFNCSGEVSTKGPTINARFEPAAQKGRVGKNFGYDLIFDGEPQGRGVSAVDVTLSFDPKLVQVASIGDLDEGTFSTMAPTPIAVVTPGTNTGGGPVPAPSCKVDDDCKICADAAGTVCKTGVCTSAGSCDYSSSTSRPPDLSCKTTADCIAKAKAIGGCNDVTKPCPVKCDAGTCKPCTAGVDCDAGGPVPTVGPGTGITPLPTGPVGPLPPVPPEVPPQTGQCTQLIKNWDNNSGKIRLSYGCIMPEDKLPRTPHIPITFKAIAKGEGSVSFKEAKVTGNIVEVAYRVKTTDGLFTILDSDEEEPPTTGGEIKLNLALRFQGIESKPKEEFNNMRVKISVGDGGLKTPVSAFGDFKADDNGIWHGSATLKVPPGKGYKVLVKGPKHLQKKICDELPKEQKERYAGTYACDKGKISLKKGDNNLDFSNIHLLVCDLPDQDGVTNSYDTSLVINLLDKSDPESLRLADLNLDGNVGAIDHSLCIEALSVRADEQ